MEAAQLLDGEVYVPTVTFVAKVKATAMELKEEPALVLNEICLPPDLWSLRADPMLSFPTSFGKRLLQCVVQPLGAVASRILTCPDGRPMTAYVEMTRFIGEIGGGRSSEHSVVEPQSSSCGPFQSHPILGSYRLQIARQCRRRKVSERLGARGVDGGEGRLPPIAVMESSIRGIPTFWK